MKDKNISVIIPTYNGSSVLSKALESLVAQTMRPDEFEIIVVDNDSKDNTKAITESYIQSNPNHSIHYVLETTPGALSARHRGFQESRGKILVYTDHDLIASPQWLSVIASNFESRTTHLVTGPSRPQFGTDQLPTWLKYLYSETEFGPICPYYTLLDFGSQRKLIDPFYVWGINISFRKQFMVELGGFNPDRFPAHLTQYQGDGEAGITMRARKRGIQAVYDPAAAVLHQIPRERLTLQYVAQRSFLQGIMSSYSEIRNDRLGTEGPFPMLKVDKPYGGIRSFGRYVLKGRSEEVRLTRLMEKQVVAGTCFHRKAINKDPKLLKWIRQENYWDYQLPS